MIIVLGGGAAIATAALRSDGPLPPPKPLARAVHDALAAPAPHGVSARIHFTNRLLDLSGLRDRGLSPLLAGASGRLWASDDGRLRIELQSTRGSDSQLLLTGRRLTLYDGSSNTLYRMRLPAMRSDRHGGHGAGAARERGALPSVARIRRALRHLGARVTINGPLRRSIAGRPAYDARVSPRRDGGQLGGIGLAWDAIRGVPLRLAIYARGRAQPVLELEATDISYGAVPASVFAPLHPQGADVEDLGTLPLGERHEAGQGSRPGGAGAGAIARRLSFEPSAPRELAGRRRSAVRVIGSGDERGALIAYGRGLDSVLVLERPAGAGDRSTGGDGPGWGAPRDELPASSAMLPGGGLADVISTPLGSLARFERGGIAYTVAGSISRADAVAAARGL